MTEPEKVPLPASPPPQHPSSQPFAFSAADKADSTNETADTSKAPARPDRNSANQEVSAHTNVPPGQGTGTGGAFKRAFSKDNRRTARHFFSAYAQTWIGLTPIWLAGEALTGQKVGTQFKKGSRKLWTAAEEVRAAVTLSSHDVVVIIEEKMRGDGSMTARTAEVIKAAGENAVLVVTSSLEKLSTKFPTAENKNKDNNTDGKGKDKGRTLPNLSLHDFMNEPALKRSMQRNGRDALVLLDKTLRHPVVITGVNGFARTRGIPHADALLRLASLGLTKIINAIPEDVKEGVEAKIEEVEEIDAEELERRSTLEERAEAEKFGKAADGPPPKVESVGGQGKDPYENMRKKNDCLIM